MLPSTGTAVELVLAPEPRHFYSDAASLTDTDHALLTDSFASAALTASTSMYERHGCGLDNMEN